MPLGYHVELTSRDFETPNWVAAERPPDEVLRRCIEVAAYDYQWETRNVGGTGYVQIWIERRFDRLVFHRRRKEGGIEKWATSITEPGS